MNTQVSFPIAKLLKEKGLKYYSTNNYFYNEHGEIKYGKGLNTYNDYPAEVNECDAPYIAEVVMWLYEKHGIWIYTRPFSSGYFHGYIVDNSGEMKEAINTINFNSPTEAYEAAIEYTLNNLINGV